MESRKAEKNVILVGLVFVVIYGAYTMVSWRNLHEHSLAIETQTTLQVKGYNLCHNMDHAEMEIIG